MRRHTRRTALINPNKVGSEEGGITLETALVMPVFLLLIFFLLWLVQSSIVTMALHSALSQSVRMTASVWYPIAQTNKSQNSNGSAEQAAGWGGNFSGARE